MEIEYHKNFKKQYQKLLPKLQKQVDQRILLFERNKFDKRLNNHSVDAAYPGCRSINITGDYRASYYEHGNVVTFLTFLTIGTHSDLY